MLIKCIIPAVLSFLLFPLIGSAEEDLQELINQASPGEIIILREGEYQGPIIIDKPVELRGNSNVIIYSDQDLPTVAIKSDQVTISQLEIRHTGSLQTPAVSIEGDQNHLSHITVNTTGLGITLHESSQNELTFIDILGPALKNSKKLHKGNAIDLWESHDNLIAHAHISSMQDGIYLERSHRNRLEDNQVKKSRYGIHLMYSDHTQLRENELSENVTGAMIMVTQDTLVQENRFVNNRQHVYSQGLLLHEAYQTKVEGNLFGYNRIGVYAEDSSDNEFVHNRWEKNFIGSQWKSANQNVVRHNDFLANVTEFQAIDSLDNDVENNYWDNHQGLDATGDGKSELSYLIDPYFLTITENYPAFQLLFQSPGMLLVKQLFKSDDQLLLKDPAPSMAPFFPEQEKEITSSLWLWIGTMILLFSSSYIYLRGRK